jgi:hypothetical protein
MKKTKKNQKKNRNNNGLPIWVCVESVGMFEFLFCYFDACESAHSYTFCAPSKWFHRRRDITERNA